MSGLTLAVCLDGPLPDADLARRLAAAGSWRCAAGLRERRVASAAACFLDGGEEPGLTPGSPLLDAGGTVLLAADARIDNRDEIAAALGVPDAARRRDDGALILEAYLRWGEAFADRLAGDFAVAVWDAALRRVLLARDALALRPLVYSVQGPHLLAASDPAQLLAAGVASRPDAQHLAAALAGLSGLPDRTFHRDIRRATPGHTVIVEKDAVRVRRHDDSWWTGVEETDLPVKVWAEELRAQLGAAVRDRLAVTGPAGLMLSGGLDSLSLAATAGRLRGEGLVPEICTISFAFDGLPLCDERETSDPVAARYDLPRATVRADDAWPLAGHPAHGPPPDGPERLQSHVLFDRTLALVRERGIVALATGSRGDAMMGAQVFDLLGRARRDGPLALWGDLRRQRHRSGVPAAHLLARDVLRPLAATLWPRYRSPGVRERLRRAIAGPAFPPWLRPDAVRRYDLREIAWREKPRSHVRGEARRRRCDRILSEREGRAAEALERVFARAGIRHVTPWADRRLAALALRIPQHVITPAGEPKGLLREAMRGLLPEAARLSARKRTPLPLYDRGLRQSRAAVEDLLRGSRAAARGLVDEAALVRAYGRFLEGGPLARSAFWRFLDVEDWLRRYHD